MAFQVSPGVSVAEVDLTTRVPIPSVSDGGFAGFFNWGPAEEVKLVSSEDELVKLFGKPNSSNYKSFFTAANFLKYSNKLRIVRAANTAEARNAVSGGSAVYIQNDAKYQNTYETSATAGTTWFAKFPGALGNSLKTSICLSDRANTTVTTDGVVSLASNTSIELIGTFDSSAGSNVFETTSGSASNVDFQLRKGDVIKHGSTTGIVTEVTNSTSFIAIQGDNTDIDSSEISAGTIVRLKRSAFEEPAENMLGTIEVNSGANAATGSSTKFDLQVHIGDILTFNDSSGLKTRRRVSSISSNSALTFSEPVSRGVTAGTTFSREWEYRESFSTPPLTSTYAYDKTENKDVSDEIHVIVVDEDGEISGTKDNRGSTAQSSKSIIEKYEGLSVADGATGDNGATIFYKDYINDHSNWIRWGDHDPTGDAVTVNSVTINKAWGTTISSGDTGVFQGSHLTGTETTVGSIGVVTTSLVSGADSSTINDTVLINSYEYLKQPEKVDVSLIMSGEASTTLATYLIQEFAEYRKDCVVFISPLESDVVNQESNEVSNIIARRNSLPSSSYAIMDGNYKYMRDQYNGVNRYVPFNGDMAGICALNDTINPFISPAGFNRGNLKAIDSLAFNPSQAERDDLYVNGVNPIVGFPGKGRILFGDKTLLAKPSAFDRINVRRLFIALEKAIANAAEFSLFEFNDDFTRAQFVAQVEPFLRDIQSNRGITDFKVVCDATNNTPVVIDRNEFRGDIFIKPARSINFIQLNFVAVGSGVDFTEVVGTV